MQHQGHRIRRFLTSTEWLLLTVTGWELLTVVVMSTFSASGPLTRLHVPAGLGIALDGSGKAGRVIMLYHSLAVPFVASPVYIILDTIQFDDVIPRLVRPTITVGYALASIGGLGFGYFKADWIANGVFLTGLTLVFFSGGVRWFGLWPWPSGPNPLSSERLVFWLTALYTLISAAIGGAAGAYFGNGFEVFLAQDVLREGHDLGQRAIVAHLNVMLTLIDGMLLLVVARLFKLDGTVGRITCAMIAVGSTIASFATWSILVTAEAAHKFINAGAFLLLAAGGTVAFWGFTRLVRERAVRQQGNRPGVLPAMSALLADPVRLGMLFELLLVNLVVTGPGIYVAFHLKRYRQSTYLEFERAIAVGHWHVLATLSAVIAFFIVVDRLRVGGLLRQFVGWIVLVGSTMAFVFVQFHIFRLPGQRRSWPLPYVDAGIALVLVALAIFTADRLKEALLNIGRKAVQ